MASYDLSQQIQTETLTAFLSHRIGGGIERLVCHLRILNRLDFQNLADIELGEPRPYLDDARVARAHLSAPMGQVLIFRNELIEFGKQLLALAFGFQHHGCLTSQAIAAAAPIRNFRRFIYRLLVVISDDGMSLVFLMSINSPHLTPARLAIEYETVPTRHVLFELKR